MKGTVVSRRCGHCNSTHRLRFIDPILQAFVYFKDIKIHDVLEVDEGVVRRFVNVVSYGR
jgi:hypothetical protein